MGDVLRVTIFTLFDEPGVLGEPARIEEERDVVAVTNFPNRTEVGHRHGLTTARVVRDGDHDQGHPIPAYLLDGPDECINIHISFEGELRGRIPALSDQEIASLSALILDVGPRRVEVRVVRNNVPRFNHSREEDLLRRSTLMGRDDFFERREVCNDVPEPIERPAPCVRFISNHHPRPLLSRHGPGTGIGEEVDDHLVAVQPEEVVPRALQSLLTLRAVGKSMACTLWIRKGSMIVLYGMALSRLDQNSLTRPNGGWGTPA